MNSSNMPNFSWGERKKHLIGQRQYNKQNQKESQFYRKCQLISIQSFYSNSCSCQQDKTVMCLRWEFPTSVWSQVCNTQALIDYLPSLSLIQGGQRSSNTAPTSHSKGCPTCWYNDPINEHHHVATELLFQGRDHHHHHHDCHLLHNNKY